MSPRFCRFFFVEFFMKECTRFISAFEVSFVVALEDQRMKHSLEFRMVKHTRVVTRGKVLAFRFYVVKDRKASSIAVRVPTFAVLGNTVYRFTIVTFVCCDNVCKFLSRCLAYDHFRCYDVDLSCCHCRC